MGMGPGEMALSAKAVGGPCTAVLHAVLLIIHMGFINGAVRQAGSSKAAQCTHPARRQRTSRACAEWPL